MNVSEAIQQRHSVRGFTSEPVPEIVIREVLSIARLAPSNSNTQPWHIAVVSGEARNALQRALRAEIDAGKKPYPAFPGSSMTGVYRDRRRACGFSYYATMGIDRDDLAGRAEIARKNYEFFGAPHVAFLSMPETMERSSAIDVGIFLQSIMLLFAERGIGCIPQGALGAYPGPVREIGDIPEGNAILCGLSFGYEDVDARINSVRMPREPLSEIASFTR